MKTLLVAAGLLVGASAWAGDVTTLYERGTTNAWSDADLTDWTVSTNNSSITYSINGGIYMENTSPDDQSKTSYSTSKTLNPANTSIVRMQAVITMGGSSGRSGSYYYITIGGVSLRVDAVNQKAQVYIDGTAQGSQVSATRNASYTFNVEVDQATSAVTYSVSGGASIAEASTTSSTAISNVVIGHNRGGQESYGSSLKLTKIEISEEAQTVTMAGYKVVYKCGEEEIKDADTSRSGVVGTNVSLTESDKASFFNGDSTKKYIYVSDDSESNAILGDGSTVITVTFREAESWSYTVNAMNGESKIAEVTSGTALEQENVTVPYPRYFNVDGTLYEKGATNSEYRQSVVISKNAQVTDFSYSATSTKNVVYYSEGEKITDAKATSAGNNMASRSSNTQCGYAESDLTLVNLPAGRYKITAVVYSNSSAGATIKFQIGDVNWDAVVSGSSNWSQQTKTFALTSAADVKWLTSGNDKNGLDLVYIQKIGDVGDEIITNGSFATDTEGWTLVKYTRNPTAGQNSTPVAEIYGASGREEGSITQSVGYLPAGNYVVSASVLSGAEAYLNVLDASDDSEITSIECTGSWYDKTVAKSFTLSEVKDVNVQFSTPAQSEGTWWSYVTNVSMIYYGSNTPVQSTMAVSASNKAKYGTFYAPYDVEIPTLIKAYTAQDNATGTALTLTEITNGTIPAYTPVILENNRSDNNTFNGTFYGLTTEGSQASSALTGTLTEYTLLEGDYVMQYHNNVTAFYPVSGDAIGKTIVANRCYIAAGQNAKSVNVIYLDSETTAINNVNATTASKPVKRIVNGKLVIEKDGKQYNAIGQEM